MTEAGVVTLDADERSNRVVAGVATPQQTALVRAAAIRAGVPAEALTVNVVGTPRAAETLQAAISRPTGGGVQIARPIGGGLFQICSLGWNVRNDAGVQGFLTAAHCLDPYDMVTGATGAPFFQPRPDIQQVGTTTGSRPFNLTNLECGGYTYCTTADAIFVSYFTTSNGAKRVAHTTAVGTNNAPGSITFSGLPWYNTITSYGVFMVGQTADKVGRTTGWTRGTVSATCVNVWIEAPGVVYRVLCAGEVADASVGFGDSGGPVWLAVGATTDAITPLGILFGANIPAGVNTCTSSCLYWFSSFERMGTHLIDDFRPDSP